MRMAQTWKTVNFPKFYHKIRNKLFKFRNSPVFCAIQERIESAHIACEKFTFPYFPSNLFGIDTLEAETSQGKVVTHLHRVSAPKTSIQRLQQSASKFRTSTCTRTAASQALKDLKTHYILLLLLSLFSLTAFVYGPKCASANDRQVLL